jgi:glucan biosynthesis protein C
MDQNSFQPTEKSPVQAAAGKTSRLFFIDHLRAALVILVFLGNGTWQSAVYALWDSIFAVGMCLAAITFFRRFFNGESRFGRFLSQQSYAVYIIHSPIVVILAFTLFLAFVLRGIDLGPLLKFGLATVIVVPTCFAAAYIVRKIPGVSRIV